MEGNDIQQPLHLEILLRICGVVGDGQRTMNDTRMDDMTK